MKTAVLLLTVAVCAATVPARAQFGGGNAAKRAEYSGPSNLGPPPPPPSVSAVVLERAKDLSLSDSQRVAIEVVRVAQDSANAPLKEQLDALPAPPLATGTDMTQQQHDDLDNRNRMLQLLMQGYKSTNDVARTKVLAVLNPDQRSKVKDLEDEARSKYEDELRKRARASAPTGGRRRPLEV